MALFGPGHLSAEPKIHRRSGKEQGSKWRIPRAVKNVACDYEKIFPRVPGMNTPVGGDDDYKKNYERERIEQHGRRAIAYLTGVLLASKNLPGHLPDHSRNRILGVVERLGNETTVDSTS
jgi:hypothetical protein